MLEYHNTTTIYKYNKKLSNTLFKEMHNIILNLK